jgi:hypothetical protein
MRYLRRRREVEDNTDQRASPISEKGRGKEGLVLGWLVMPRPWPSSGRERRKGKAGLLRARRGREGEGAQVAFSIFHSLFFPDFIF